MVKYVGPQGNIHEHKTGIGTITQVSLLSEPLMFCPHERHLPNR